MPRASLADPTADHAIRNMPPTELLPRPLAEAITAYNVARIAYDQARTEATHFEQVELAHAREEDIIALADAQEAGKKAPAPKREAEATEQLAALTRDVKAKELVEDRARARLEEARANHAGAITDQAEKTEERAAAKVKEIIAGTGGRSR